MVLGFYGLGWAPGGSPEPPTGFCPIPVGEDLPSPDTGPQLSGAFTVGQDPNDVETVSQAYIIHLKLQQKTKIHLFNMREVQGCDPSKPETCSFGLCNFTESQLQDLAKWLPCNLGIGAAFGFPADQYIPVIESLKILNKDGCWTKDEMLEGEIQIRLVPQIPPK